MSEFLALTIAGIASYGCVYALGALGLVVTYTTSGVFNFAQGAVGMIGAFAYWQLVEVWHWPAWAALVAVAAVAAPALGAFLELFLIRKLERASLEARLTVTVALLLVGIATANSIWDQSTGRTLPPFFNGHQVTIGGVGITWHQIIVMAGAAAVAVGLRLFFRHTRPGIATRAVVEDRELTSLAGAVPGRFSAFGWALGCALAALAGILIASTTTLDVNSLALLVVNGYAAATVGRLRSLPLTFAGAIVLGLLQSYAIGYLPTQSAVWSDVVQTVPMAFLLAAMLAVPQARSAHERRVQRTPSSRVSDSRQISGSTVLVASAALAAVFLSSSDLNYATRALALGIVFLSVVLLTGFGGQVSLCQLSFAGIGAYVMAKAGGGDSLLGLGAAVGIAAAVGFLVALPALRLRGLYLALATLAFAEAADAAFFNNTQLFGQALSIGVPRVSVLGLAPDSNISYLMFESVIFACVGVGVLRYSSSRFGRRGAALHDSPEAAETLAVRGWSSKLALFSTAAGIAGLGGALYGGAQGQVGPNDFSFLLSLTMLLIAVSWGVRKVTGALLGGVSTAVGPVLASHLHTPRDLFGLLVGVVAVGIAHRPEGMLGTSGALRPRFASPPGRPESVPATPKTTMVEI